MEKRRESFILLLILFLSAAGMWSLRCTFESPATPNWDVNLQVPLINKRYEMTELVDDVKELEYPAGSDIIYFNHEEKLDTIKVGNSLRVGGIESKAIRIRTAGSIEDSVAIPSDVMVLDLARIKQGVVWINMSVESGGDPVIVSFIMPDFVDEYDNPFRIDWRIDDAGQEPFDLENYSFKPRTDNPTERFVRFEGEISSANGGNVDLNIEIEIEDLIFSHIEGTLNHFELPLDDIEVNFDMPEEFEGFQLQSLTGTITLETDLDILVSTDILIEGRDASNNIIGVPIPIQQSFNAGDDFVLVINNLQNIINANPEKIVLSGNILLGDGNTPSVITDEHTFTGSVHFNAPLIFQIPSAETTIEPDTITIDEDARDMFRDNLKHIRLYARFRNAIPLGAKATIYFSSDYSDERIYDLTDGSPNAIIKSVTLASAPIIVLERPSESIMDIEITEEDLRLFAENEEVYFGLKLEFLGSEEMVQIRPSDYIEITAHIEVSANTKAPKDDENGGGR